MFMKGIFFIISFYFLPEEVQTYVNKRGMAGFQTGPQGNLELVSAINKLKHLCQQGQVYEERLNIFFVLDQNECICRCGLHRKRQQPVMSAGFRMLLLSLWNLERDYLDFHLDLRNPERIISSFILIPCTKHEIRPYITQETHVQCFILHWDCPIHGFEAAIPAKHLQNLSLFECL